MDESTSPYNWENEDLAGMIIIKDNREFKDVAKIYIRTIKSLE